MQFRPRAVFVVLGIIISAFVIIQVILVARSVLIWIFVALFLALALNPAVEWFQAHGVPRRGLAVTITYIGAAARDRRARQPLRADPGRPGRQLHPGGAGLRRADHRGEGRLGFLEREYQITDRVREAIGDRGATGVLGVSGTALAVTKSVITAIVAVVTIAFLTLFMLLEGPAWVERVLLAAARREAAALATGRLRHLPHDRRLRHGQPGDQPDRRHHVDAVLLALGVPYAVALGLLVAILDLVPLAGATIAAVIVTTVGFIDSTTSGVVAADLLRPLPATREPRPAAGRLRPDGATLAARRADRGADRRRARRCDRRAGRDPDGRNAAGAPRRLARASPWQGREPAPIDTS